ncbi:gamma-glutamylcyclotransferase [Mucilaginibacter roseus]|uniref:Gamma-glutamylcyclotransferase n=1 Tax=Mucilaginibacter roseus TaxID=1528868 RepID=A0ABS8U1K9_9SPHI|nr:gamma-glutamylcyclotransferase family protein [Mucilaginibacter roseus]MCD8740142.1 gamma-glutamylcyclotransferase [Mucilaginibacter roseus]
MTDKPNLLFVYGTLLIKHNEFAAYLQKHCTFISKGRIAGTLYDIGEYPGAVIDNSGGYVYGSVYSIDKPDEILPVLDDYEGLSPNDPQPQEYLRLLSPIETDEALLSCWMYVYNWPVDRLKIIDGGNYLTYKSDSSL